MEYEYEGKTEKEAIEKAASELGMEKNQFDVEILESQKKSLFKNGYVKIRVHTVESKSQVSSEFDGKVPNATKRADNPAITSNPLPEGEYEEKILNFVKTVIEKMGYDASCEIMFREDKKIGVKFTSSSSSILIGKKGKNLDALQLLANVYAGNISSNGIRVILDTENYRLHREESLVRLAYNTADRVRQRKKAILLEPMNPFERRIIHTTLNDIADIGTESEGDGLYKQVRVFYKGAK